MEREALARDFGGDVVFHGAVDNQYTLPFGTPEQVAEEVRRTAEIFRSCRWICAPCHNIQPNTPVENVIAMYEAAARIKATA
jgi:uroporphyrinogen decarboxylase